MTDLLGRIEIQDLIEAFPFYAMILDECHRVVAANQYFFDATGITPGTCGFDCHRPMHQMIAAPVECPLTRAVRTGKSAEQLIDIGRSGALQVTVYPLTTPSEDGRRLFLHLARPAADVSRS